MFKFLRLQYRSSHVVAGLLMLQFLGGSM